jgi:hypothetical protein
MEQVSATDQALAQDVAWVTETGRDEEPATVYVMALA